MIVDVNVVAAQIGIDRDLTGPKNLAIRRAAIYLRESIEMAIPLSADGATVGILSDLE